jgi:hypothetical protein
MKKMMTPSEMNAISNPKKGAAKKVAKKVVGKAVAKKAVAAAKKMY